MGLDEMKEITEDRWDEDIWGAVEPALGNQRLKLIFYFGQNDHWVADHTRDDLIATRAFQEDRPETWKPKMLVDGEGIPHSFCISKYANKQGILNDTDMAKDTAPLPRIRPRSLYMRLCLQTKSRDDRLHVLSSKKYYHPNPSHVLVCKLVIQYLCRLLLIHLK